MTESIRDQLYRALGEFRLSSSYPFTLGKKDRNPKYDSKNSLKWELRLFPDHGFIANVGQLVDIARKIDSTILITLSQNEKTYLVFL